MYIIIITSDVWLNRTIARNIINDENVFKERVKLLESELAIELKKEEVARLEKCVKESNAKCESELRKCDAIMKDKGEEIKQLNKNSKEKSTAIYNSEMYIRKQKRVLSQQDDIIMKLRVEIKEKDLQLNKKRKADKEEEHNCIRKRIRIEEEERIRIKNELERNLKS